MHGHSQQISAVRVSRHHPPAFSSRCSPTHVPQQQPSSIAPITADRQYTHPKIFARNTTHIPPAHMLISCRSIACTLLLLLLSSSSPLLDLLSRSLSGHPVKSSLAGGTLPCHPHRPPRVSASSDVHCSRSSISGSLATRAASVDAPVAPPQSQLTPAQRHTIHLGTSYAHTPTPASH